jgi:type I restriction enzyme S subunit
MIATVSMPLGQLLRRSPRYGINAAAVPLKPGVATYIRITDIDEWGRFAPSPKVGVAHPGAANYRLGEGELVFARTGASVGKSYLYDPNDGELIYAGFLINVAPDPKRLNPKYFALYVQTKDYWDWISRTSVRSGQPGVNGRELATLEVPVPDIETQQAIAEAINDVDALISSLERSNAKERAIKHGLMQQLLTGRTRLPGFNGEWSGTTVGEVAEFLTGYPFASASFTSAGIRLIRGSNVKRGKIDWSLDIAKYWAASNSVLHSFALRDGDIVIAMDGALVGRSFARITEAELPAYLVQRVARLRGKVIDQDLLYQWIGSRDFVNHVDGVKTHTAIPHISPRDIRDFEISIPKDINEQRAIAKVLSDTDQQIELLGSRLAKARNIKTGFMQQLLTGRTRLPVEVMT